MNKASQHAPSKKATQTLNNQNKSTLVDITELACDIAPISQIFMPNTQQNTSSSSCANQNQNSSLNAALNNSSGAVTPTPKQTSSKVTTMKNSHSSRSLRNNAAIKKVNNSREKQNL